MTTSGIIPGAEPLSVEGTTSTGVLALHGFTGNPSSMRTVAEALAARGHHVELPRLPGHGTSIDDMLTTRWADWLDAALAAHDRLAARADHVVVTGLSMGGTLTLWTALERPTVAGIACVNPATLPQTPDVLAMVREMIADGTAVMPGIGSDIADPSAVELAYEGTPLEPLLSLMEDGLAPLADRYGELTMPLRLFTSRQDHVVPPSDSVHLAECYGGDVDHTWLERSFHVATQDYDRDLIATAIAGFVDRVTAGQPGIDATAGRR